MLLCISGVKRSCPFFVDFPKKLFVCVDVVLFVVGFCLTFFRPKLRRPRALLFLFNVFVEHKLRRPRPFFFVVVVSFFC